MILTMVIEDIMPVVVRFVVVPFVVVSVVAHFVVVIIVAALFVVVEVPEVKVFKVIKIKAIIGIDQWSVYFAKVHTLQIVVRRLQTLVLELKSCRRKIVVSSA